MSGTFIEVVPEIPGAFGRVIVLNPDGVTVWGDVCGETYRDGFLRRDYRRLPGLWSANRMATVRRDYRDLANVLTMGCDPEALVFWQVSRNVQRRWDP